MQDHHQRSHESFSFLQKYWDFQIENLISIQILRFNFRSKSSRTFHATRYIPHTHRVHRATNFCPAHCSLAQSKQTARRANAASEDRVERSDLEALISHLGTRRDRWRAAIAPRHSPAIIFIDRSRLHGSARGHVNAALTSPCHGVHFDRCTAIPGEAF